MQAFRFRRVASLFLFVAFIAAGPGQAQITEYDNLREFDAATATLRELDFEDIYSLNSDGMFFRNPYPLEIKFCGAPFCTDDPDNPYPIPGQNVMDLINEADISFPPYTISANLEFQMPDATFKIIVTAIDGSITEKLVTAQAYVPLSVPITTPKGVAKVTIRSSTIGRVWVSEASATDRFGAVFAADFEDQPGDSYCVLSSCEAYDDNDDEVQPLPNPLSYGAVLFDDPWSIDHGACPSSTCPADPDNPVANIQLFISDGGIQPVGHVMTFPVQAFGAMLVLAGNGGNPWVIEATDRDGNTLVTSGSGTPFGQDYVGFSSPSGIDTIEIVDVNGRLAMSGVLYGKKRVPSLSRP